MRLIKLGESEPDGFPSREGVFDYFTRKLPSRKLKGAFGLTEYKARMQGFFSGTLLLFSYKKQCMYMARSKSGIRYDGDWPYFLINLKTLKQVGGGLDDFEREVHRRDLYPKSIVNSRQWAVMSDECEEFAKRYFNYEDSDPSGSDDGEDLKQVGKTVRKALMDARIGQGQFRNELIAAQKSCYVTGITDKRLVRASHIKSWKLSTNQERLDRHNGLLLCPNYDHLFDRHLLSFDSSGRMRVSRSITAEVLKKLGVQLSAIVRDLGKRTRRYLAHHYAVFREQEKARMMRRP